MITIFDYGAGNLRSVQNTLHEIGAKYKLVDDVAGLREATKLILPGVGHFGQMIRTLDAMRVREPLLEFIRSGSPFLGICLGLQALFADSEEAPGLAGLNIFPGTIKRFEPDQRVPHMGWDQLETARPGTLLNGLPDGAHMYFANSYYAPVIAETTAVCTYRTPFSAVIEAGNIHAVQFHPEKSGPLGLAVVRNFVNL
ncbi:MAG: imidazole glycerol phosphate synthase subunit HisH [Acidobacteria bacterium]|nr:imidazole glycerol phosphate synthase subunit HisH [Acidobacteriota bacterium]